MGCSLKGDHSVEGGEKEKQAVKRMFFRSKVLYILSPWIWRKEAESVLSLRKICSLGRAGLPLLGQAAPARDLEVKGCTWEAKIPGRMGVATLSIIYYEFSLKGTDHCTIKNAYSHLFFFLLKRETSVQEEY